MPPLVESGDGHSEIVGEFFDGEQPVEGFHGRILQPDPFSRMSFGLSVTLQLHSYTGVVLTGEIGCRSFRRHWLQRSGEMCDTTEITAAS